MRVEVKVERTWKRRRTCATDYIYRGKCIIGLMVADSDPDNPGTRGRLLEWL